MDLGGGGRGMLTSLWCEAGCHCSVVLAELSKQSGGDGEQVTAGQRLHFANVPEGGAHHNRAVTILLVVVVNLCDTHHTCSEETCIYLGGNLLWDTEVYVLFQKSLELKFYKMKRVILGTHLGVHILNLSFSRKFSPTTNQPTSNPLLVPGSSWGS